MSVTEHKELLRTAAQAFNKIDQRSGWYDFHAESVQAHGLGPAPLDKAGMKAFYTALWGGFPDLTIQIDELVGEADRVVSRVTASGTHNGPSCHDAFSASLGMDCVELHDEWPDRRRALRRRAASYMPALGSPANIVLQSPNS